MCDRTTALISRWDEYSILLLLVKGPNLIAEKVATVFPMTRDTFLILFLFVLTGHFQTRCSFGVSATVMLEESITTPQILDSLGQY